MRALHVVGTSAIGGTERFLLDLVTRHRQMGIESSICVLDRPGELAEAYAAAATRVHHIHGSGSWLSLRRGWLAVLETEAPSVLVLYGARANVLGRLVRGARPRPIVAALRSTVVNDRGGAAAPLLDRLTFGRVRVCVSNSREALDELTRRGYPAERLAYIPSGVDLARFTALSRPAARAAFGVGPADVVLLCLANLKPVKNHHVLIEASARLWRRGLAHTLWLVGEGPERARLERCARAHPRPESIVFTGLEADPRARLAAADLFVLPSRWEGTPTSVLEAMAAGLPIVATNVGDLPYLVQDGENGRLVAPGNADALANALTQGLDLATRTRWAGASQRRAGQFSADATARQYAELLRWTTQPSGGPMPAPYSVETAPRRILRVLSRLNVGGPTLHVVLLSRRMQGADYRTRLVAGTVGPNEGDMTYFAAEQGVDVHMVPALGRSVHALRDLTALASLLRLMFAFRPDVVHTHASKAGALGRLAAVGYNLVPGRHRRAAVVHTYHGHTFRGYFGPWVSWMFRTIERLLGRVTDRVVVLSEQQRHDIVEQFRIAPGDRTRIVPLGLDLSAFFAVDGSARHQARGALRLSESTKVIVIAGRLTAIKNHALLLRAFERCSRELTTARLLVVGDGELRGDLTRMVHERGLTEKVQFLGWRRDMAALYAAADVTALSSINEGTPVSLIEAIAAGCPVVATRVGGVPDVVDATSGAVVEPGDELALATALVSALSRGRLDDRTRQRMHRYSIERLVQDLKRLYDEILGVAPSRVATGERV